MKNKNIFMLISVLAAVSGHLTIHAAQLAYEGFDYTSGEDLHNKSGGAGWGTQLWNEQNGGSNYQTANAVPLTYSGLSSSDGYAVGGGSFVRVGREFDTSSGSTWNNEGLVTGGWVVKGTFYTSFLLRRDSDQNVSVGLARATNVSPQQSNIGNRFILKIDSSTDAYSLLYRSDNTGTAANDFTTLATGETNTVGETDLIVMGIDYGDGTTDASVDLWINPSSLGGSAPSALVSASDVTSGSGGNAFDGALGSTVRAFNWYPGSGSNQGSIDELRFATTFAEATPLAAIPESSTFTMILGVLLMFLAFLRKNIRR